MDHNEVLELIDLAAAEPDGIARLAAGDTPEAWAVAGHLAGCESCSLELARTVRTTAVAREAIRELPDPALRARTLAFVREVGRDRSAAPAAGSGSTVVATAAAPWRAGGVRPDLATAPSRPGGIVAIGRRGPRFGWWAAAVAAVLVAAIGGFAIGGGSRPAGPSDDGGGTTAILTTMRIATQPDAVRVQLAPVGGGPGSGALIYSPSIGQLAMATTGLAAAPAGTTYACWVEQGGQRRRIGVLYVSAAGGAWAGPVSGLPAISGGATFGVSLMPADGSTGTPVLLGS